MKPSLFLPLFFLISFQLHAGFDFEGDGIFDQDDECPFSSRRRGVDEHGCFAHGLSVVRVEAYFSPGSSELTPGPRPALDELAHYMKENPKARVVIKGFADGQGDFVFNQRLSEERARAMAQYLSSKDVDSSRFRIIGRGEANPLASNQRESGRAENRRALVVVIGQY